MYASQTPPTDGFLTYSRDTLTDVDNISSDIFDHDTQLNTLKHSQSDISPPIFVLTPPHIHPHRGALPTPQILPPTLDIDDALTYPAYPYSVSSELCLPVPRDEYLSSNFSETDNSSTDLLTHTTETLYPTGDTSGTHLPETDDRHGRGLHPQNVSTPNTGNPTQHQLDGPKTRWSLPSINTRTLLISDGVLPFILPSDTTVLLMPNATFLNIRETIKRSVLTSDEDTVTTTTIFLHIGYYSLHTVSFNKAINSALNSLQLVYKNAEIFITSLIWIKGFENPETFNEFCTHRFPNRFLLSTEPTRELSEVFPLEICEVKTDSIFHSWVRRLSTLNRIR